MLPHLILSVSLTVAATASAQISTNFQLPDIGDPSQEFLGPIQEVDVGRGVMRSIRRQGLLLEDPFLQDYLTSIGQSIAIHADHDTGFNFFLVRDGTVNAFAAPGGYIGVHTGLLLATQTEAELAGVLAHEAAHVAQLHVARQFADANRMQIPLAASLLAAVLIGTQNSEAGAAAATGAMAVSAQRQIDFTREHEYEADRVGIEYLIRSGYDPHGMPDFFERLAKLTMGRGSQIPEFLRTHPVESRRIAETRSRVEQSGARRSSGDSQSYHFAQARAAVILAADPLDQARQLRQRIKDGAHRNPTAQYYGLALALQKAGRLDEAYDAIDVALQADPESLPLLITAAEIQFGRDRGQESLSLFQKAQRLYPDDYSLAMSFGDALIRARRYREAMALLRPHLGQDELHAQAYALNAQAARGNGMIADSHGSMAQYYELIGQPKLAVAQAELALQAPDVSPYLRTRLEAQVLRLKEEIERERG